MACGRGGTFGWMRPLEGGAALMLTCDDGGSQLGSWAAREGGNWMAGRDDDEGNSVTVIGLSLEEAMRVAELLPPPDADDPYRLMTAEDFRKLDGPTR